MAEIGDLLREHRRAAGWTQEELAERAGISPRSISEMERGGGHIPRRDTIALLARALGMDGPAREALDQLVAEQRKAQRTSTILASRVSASAESGNELPRPLTSFIGRDDDLNRLSTLLETPLVTLTGPGGIGKTRLAQELALRNRTRFVDGCRLAELGGLADAGLVAAAIATAIGLRDHGARDLMSALVEYIGDKHILLVVDNCEHLVEVCAELIAQLLRRCARLHILTTSREPLAINGETVWQVRRLDVPTTGAATPVDLLAVNPAVRLFLDRARAVAEIDLSKENASAVARICELLDGIPLAIELAAARARMLSIDQLVAMLETDSGLLTATTRDSSPRHRTLRATIDWSYDLLNLDEQTLLGRLSVFAGGWTLEGAEAVCGGGALNSGGLLDMLRQLVDKSMVVVDSRHPAARFRLLEPIRHYALDRLEAAGEATEYRHRHARYYLDLARSGAPNASGPEEITSLDRFEIEHANLRVALRWALSNDQTEAALETASALFRYWERRGQFQEGCSWLEHALVQADTTTARPMLRCRARNALAFLCWRGGAALRARPHAEQALSLSREIGYARGTAQALINLGMVAYLQHDNEQAVSLLEDSVAVARELDQLPILSVALAFLGRAMLWTKGPDDPLPVALLDESLRVARAADSRYASGHALATTGDLQWRQGRGWDAVALWKEALLVFADLSDRRGIAGCLERLALAAADQSELQTSAWLFGAAQAQHAALGLQLRASHETDHAHFATYECQEAARVGCAEAFSAGQVASLIESVAYALRGSDLDRERLQDAPACAPAPVRRS